MVLIGEHDDGVTENILQTGSAIAHHTCTRRYCVEETIAQKTIGGHLRMVVA